jgi:ABC-2 type transport system permease protein
VINQIFALALKEFKVIIHDRGAAIGLFLIPIAFILVMTVALQGVFDSGGSNNPVQILIVNQDQGEIAEKVISDLKSVSGLTLIDQADRQSLTRTKAEELIVDHQYSIALIFPQNFSRSILDSAGDAAAQKATVSFVIDPAVGSQLLSPARGMVEGLINREASLARMPGQIKQGFSQMAAGAPASQAQVIQNIGSAFTSQTVTSIQKSQDDLGVSYEVVSPAKFQSIRLPTSVEQNVPGYTIYGVFFIMQTIVTGLFREKSDGTFRRLQAAPISRAAYLIGKMIPYYVVNLFQIALMFTVGVVVFKMNLGNSPVALILMALATAAAATGLGLMVSTLGKSLEQTSGMVTLLAIVLSALGGSMVPIWVMPHFMQTISFTTPHAWALTGFQNVIVRGQGVRAILPDIGMLMGFALVFWSIAIWRFRFEEN